MEVIFRLVNMQLLKSNWYQKQKLTLGSQMILPFRPGHWVCLMG